MRNSVLRALVELDHKKQQINRRFVLRAAGVALTLPWLDQIASAAPSRFKPWGKSLCEPTPRAIFCYIPNGVNIHEWIPKSTGKNYQLSPTLQSIDRLRNDFSVLSGLGHPHSEGGHSGADTWLTGANLKAVPGKDYANSISIDQIIAEHHGRFTRFSSLQFSDQSGTGSAGHSHTLSFDRSGTPLPAENSPSRIFQRLFIPETDRDRAATLERYAERKSILDNVYEQAKRLEKNLGKEDSKKLEEYLTSVRETEKRVTRLESWIDKPKPTVEAIDLQLNSQAGNAHDRPMFIDVMMELAYLAFATDSTRVISFEWSREAGGFGGGGENHHELSHHGGDPTMLDKLAAIDRFHIERLGRFLDFMKATKESEHSMLDSTIVFFGSGMNSGQGGEHSPKNLPLLIAGGNSLGLKHNQHIAFNPEKAPPLSNVLLQIALAVGSPIEKFSDATSGLSELVTG